jgi:hypothetical protein
MSDENHKKCYGTIFPQTLHAPNDQPVRGKVFTYHLVIAGGMFRSDRKVSADIQSWGECVECPEFEHCYKFSLGRLLLENTIGEK